MIQLCGLAKDKKQSFIALGIVTLIDPNTHNQVKQISIEETYVVSVPL